MKLTALELRGFKNLDLSFDTYTGINLILAPNGSGKTNILESIYFLSNGVSYRNYPEVSLVGHDIPDFAKITGKINGDEASIVISRFENGSAKQLFINKQKKSILKFSSLIDTVLFSPGTVDLVAGSPDVRRTDIDDFLSSYDPTYKKELYKYKRIIRNRNKLLGKLKSGLGSLEELDFWTDEMVSLGSTIITKRVDILNNLKDDITNIGKDLFREEFPDLILEYSSKIDQNDVLNDLQRLIEENLDKEIEAGTSLYGPHRDDIIFNMKDKSLRIFGSRGQQRIAALVYKLAITNFLNNSEVVPVILLDDVMSELDPRHRLNIESYLRNMKNQLFLTSCDEKEFSKEFITSSNLISL